MFSVTKQFTILEALNHVKQNISPKALTFDEGFKKLTGNTVKANNLGEFELNEPIVDTTQFLRLLTMAMYPNLVYPEDWIIPNSTEV